MMRKVLIIAGLLLGLTDQVEAQRNSGSYALAMCDIRNGQEVTFETAISCDTVFIVDKESREVIEDVKIISGQLIVSSIPAAGHISPSGLLDPKSKALMKQSKGKTVVIELNCRRENGVKAIESISFTVKGA